MSPASRRSGPPAGRRAPGRPAAKRSPAGRLPAGAGGKAGQRGRPPSARVSTGGADPAGRADRVLVGRISPLARVAGALAVAGVLARLIAPALPLGHVGSRDLIAGPNGFDWFVLIPLAAVVGAAGLLCVLGRLPRLGLAVLLVTGSASVGLLLRACYLLAAGQRTSLDLPLGIGVSFRYQVGAGLVLLVVADGLLAAAFGVAALAWSRTEMDDDGGLDPLRPRLVGWGVAAGVATAIVLGTAPYRSTVGLSLALLERTGLDLAGGVVTIAVVTAWAVFAATLRPRLAAVGAYAGLAGLLGTDAFGAALLAVRSPVLAISAGAVGEMLAAVAFALLAVAAWRLPVRTTLAA